MELKTVKIEKPEDINFILGQSHFIKTVEDIHEALVTSVPGIKFGLAFCEATVWYANSDKPFYLLIDEASGVNTFPDY